MKKTAGNTVSLIKLYKNFTYKNKEMLRNLNKNSHNSIEVVSQ